MTWKDRLARVRRYLPWVSLLSGVGGAFLMNRTPQRAWVVVVAAVIGWGALSAFTLVDRSRTMSHAQKKGARFAFLLGSQLAVQQALLFPLPFYARAAQLVHVPFFVLYACALAIALWDPLFEKAIHRVSSALALQAFSVFVGLQMVLPVFGLSNMQSLVAAGTAAAISSPMLVALTLPFASAWRRRAFSLFGAAFVLGGTWLAAPLVPPAPLELKAIGTGTSIQDRELAGVSSEIAFGAEVYCHSAVRAPLGLKDALFHVWKKDGRQIDRIALSVSGGREAGFRTWSRKRGLEPGSYTCAVTTDARQVLGETSFVMLPRE